jgi:phage repressor protein C with HTH and peptisase S24 domain
MLPLFKHGGIVICFDKRPKIGDVVVATIDDKEVIKRVDQLTDKKVYLIGDNQASSTDSRTYGYISKQSIVGVVIFYMNLPFLRNK